MATDEHPKSDLADPEVDKSARSREPEGELVVPITEETEEVTPRPSPLPPAVSKRIPPPKPRSSDSDLAPPNPSPSVPAPRAPIIGVGAAPVIGVGGSPTQPHASSVASAWTRPSDPPAPSKRPSQPAPDLRSKLGIQRAAEPARPIPAAPPSRPARAPDEVTPTGDATRVAPRSPLGSEPFGSVVPPLPPVASSVPAVAAPPPSSPQHKAPLPAFALPEDLREPPLPAFALPVEAPVKPLLGVSSERPQPGRALPAYATGSEATKPLPSFDDGDEPTPPPADEEKTPKPILALPDAAAAQTPSASKDQPGALEAALNAAFGHTSTKEAGRNEVPTATKEPAPKPTPPRSSDETPTAEALDIPVEIAEPTPPPVAAPEPPTRPKSEPARLRGGPPRPRASSPDFAAVRAASTPTPHGTAIASPEVPGPPRVPRFPLSAGAPQPEPPRRSDPVVPASAIAVMKIVAVGDPAHPIAELDDDALEQDESEAATEGEAPAKAAPEKKEAAVEELEELADEDIAPIAAPARTPKKPNAPPAPSDIEREASISAAQAEALVASAPPLPTAVAREAEAPKPPPPPQRKPKTAPSLPKPAPQTKRRQKPPWWEEVFSEDFERASLRLSQDQIRREVDFIEESLGVASGGIVLDLGCGSGNHAVELASRGYGVVGYDLSLYQLALASEIANERGQKLNFLQGDMREMAFEEMFDGIFSWNTSFGYFEEEKNLLVAERVFQALRPGGMFLIDVVNRDYAAASSPSSLWYEGDSCVCMDDMSLDFITSRLRVKRSVILDDGRTREAVYSIRLYSLHELGKLLHDVGFRVTEASGHPGTPGVFFGESSPRIIMLAQKP